MTPSVSILAEPPVAVVDKNVDKHGTRAVAEAYLKFLYTRRGPGASPRKNYYRPRTRRGRRRHAARVPEAQALHDRSRCSAAGRRRRPRTSPTAASFDQIYKPGSMTSIARVAPTGRRRVDSAVLGSERAAGSLPGFGLSLGFTLALPVARRADPARRGSSGRRRRSAAPRSGDGGAVAARAGGVPPELRRGARRRAWSTSSSASSWPGCWRATASRAGSSSTRWSTCRSRCRPRWRASRSPRSTSSNGWLGRFLEPLGIKVAFTPLGVVVAHGLRRPAVRRADGAAGARGPRPRTWRRPRRRWAPRACRRSARVILPAVLPAALTGFALAFARAVGEYGSVVFISGNMPMKTEIAPLLDHHQAGAVRLRRARRRSRW